jgi:hypothetical protein
LNLRAKFESSMLQFSFKRLVPGGFNLGFIGSTCTALPGRRQGFIGDEHHGKDGEQAGDAQAQPLARGLHAFTFQLNLSALYGTGGARRGCVAGVKGGSGGV